MSSKSPSPDVKAILDEYSELASRDHAHDIHLTPEIYSADKTALLSLVYLLASELARVKTTLPR